MAAETWIASVSVGVAALAIVANAWSTRNQLRQQARSLERQLQAQREQIDAESRARIEEARSERLWDSRAALYADVLAWLFGSFVAGLEAEDVEVVELPPGTEERLQLFGSEDVVIATAALVKAARDIRIATRVDRERQQEREPDATISWRGFLPSDDVLMALGAAGDAAVELGSALRADLGLQPLPREFGP
jgi:hypothetical protein